MAVPLGRDYKKLREPLLLFSRFGWEDGPRFSMRDLSRSPFPIGGGNGGRRDNLSRDNLLSGWKLYVLQP
jgi:hypothetical protein